MNFNDVVIEPGSLVRAYRRFFNGLNEAHGGFGSAFKVEADDLQADCGRVLRASQGESVDGLTAEPYVYQGRSAIILRAEKYKFVLLRQNELSSVYNVVNIYKL